MKRLLILLIIILLFTVGCRAAESTIVFDSELRKATEEEYESCNTIAYPSLETTMIFKLYISGDISGFGDRVETEIPGVREVRANLQETLDIESVAGEGAMQNTGEIVYYDYTLFIDASEVTEEELKNAFKDIECKIDIDDEIGNLIGIDGSFYELIEMGRKEYTF